jgi:hypothetical protein
MWVESDFPSAMISCLRGEYLPRAFLRIFHGAEDGQFKVMEHELESCLYASYTFYTTPIQKTDRFFILQYLQLLHRRLRRRGTLHG